LAVGYKMKLILFLTFIFSEAAFSEDVKKNYLIDQNKIEFYEFDQQHILVSSDCVNFKCEGIQHLKEVSIKAIRNKLIQGKNPGSVICLEQLKGELVFGTNNHGMNSFCKFKDNSLIDTGTLTFYANRNDKERK